MASTACCTLPPVEVDYTVKGSYEQIDGVKTYVTGDKSSKKAIVFAYDIFGYPSQLLQGADLLASQGFEVVIPDLLLGRFAKPEWFEAAPGTEGEKKKMEYFGVIHQYCDEAAAPRKKVLDALRADGAEKIGMVGFCWGAKVTVCEKSVDALAMAHPSLLTVEDAKLVNVPICFLPSKDEDKELMDEFTEIIKQNKAVADKSIFKTIDAVHGFAAARADLHDEKLKEVYVQAYTDFAKFFKNVLA